MKGTFLGDLTSILERRARAWSEADRVLAETIALDIAALTQRSVMGRAVPDEEWAQVRASIANLASGSASDGAMVFREWVQTVFAGLAAAIL